MKNDPDLPPTINMRLSPRTRYFGELAARICNVSLTEYVEQAIIASLTRVSLDSLDEDEPGTTKHPISASAERLWSEHPIIRLQAMSLLNVEHYMSKDQKAIWNYLFTRSDLVSNRGQMNRRLITEQWQDIKAKALGNGGGK